MSPGKRPNQLSAPDQIPRPSKITATPIPTTIRPRGGVVGGSGSSTLTVLTRSDHDRHQRPNQTKAQRGRRPLVHGRQKPRGSAAANSVETALVDGSGSDG